MATPVSDRLREAMNGHDIDAFVGCFTPDYRSEQPAHPDRAFGGRDQVRTNWSAIFREIPDVRGELVRSAASEGEEWGEWTIESDLPGLHVRGWRPGDRLAGRSRKVQDVFVDAKIPRSEREAWPLVVRGDDVIAVPGIVEAEGVKVSRS